MGLSLRNGDYVLDGTGGLRRAEGREALLERVLFRLTARRGTFPFLPELGSRLWQLGQLSAAQRQSAAEQYVAEALAPEDGADGGPGDPGGVRRRPGPGDGVHDLAGEMPCPSPWKYRERSGCVKTTEEIYQALLAGLCPAGGVHAGGGLRPGGAPVRRGGGASGTGHPGGVGAGSELSPDGPGRLSGLPRPDAGHHPDGGHKSGGDSPVLRGAGGGHGT